MPADSEALTITQRFLLYLGALQLEKRDRRLKAIFIINGGMLNLRRIEIVHLCERWIDWRNGVINIPPHDPCSCKPCWKAARDKWLREGFNRLQSNEYYDPDTSFEDVGDSEIMENLDSESLENILYSTRFSTKNNRGRTVSFGWSRRATGILMVFFDEYGPYLDDQPRNLNNIIEDAAQNAPGLDPEDVHVHGLRKTGMNFRADAGLDEQTLRAVSGQDSKDSLAPYLKDSREHNTYAIYHIFGKGDEAPQPVKGTDKVFPLANDTRRLANEPFNPMDYGEDRRHFRALQKEDADPLKIHPRSGNIPRSQENFPSDVSYNAFKHDIPNHRQLTKDQVPQHLHITESTTATNVDDFDDENGKINAGVTGQSLQRRIDYEDKILRESPESESYYAINTIKRAAFGLGAGSCFTALVWAQSGVLENILSGELTAIYALGLVTIVYPPSMIWHVHDITHENPSNIEPNTNFDTIILLIYNLINRMRNNIISLKNNIYKGLQKMKSSLTSLFR